MKKVTCYRFVLAAMAALFAVSLHAETPFGREVTVIDEHTSLCDIFSAMGRPQPKGCQFKSRSIRPHATAPLQEIRFPKEKAGAIKAINFAYDSYQLDGRSRRILDHFSQFLNHPDNYGIQFILEGHTDSRGSDRYNLKLSLARAQSVQRYLTQHHHVANQRLRIVGKGERKPLLPEDPEAADNRRVEFVNRIR